MVHLDPSWLQHVEKPARYMGGEWNSVVKDHSEVDVTICLGFPDVYEVGMSHLGIKILYSIVNERPDFAAERVCAPWHDMEAEMRKRNIPLHSLETKTPVRDFDFLGFTLQYEMSYTNILNMLDLGGIPFYSKDRDLSYPLLIAGGPCAYNMEPIADFFDIVNLGEAEESMIEVMDLYKAEKAAGFPDGKEGFLRKAALIPGTYVPALYEPEYTEAGDFKGMKILAPEAPAVVEKRIIEDMEQVHYPTKPVVPYLDVVHDRAVLELFRGCTRGCRFCQAGMLYRPVRERTPERLVQLAKEIIANTGYNEISLMSLSSADYSKLPELVDMLMEEFKDKQVSVSLPSLRIDAFSIDIAKKVQQVRKSGLTFAPEAGSQRMRDVINKGVSEEDLIAACTNAFKSGWNTVKLYFMMGLPTETDEDVAGIADLAYKVLDLHREITGKRNGKVTVSVSFFVPKSHSPYQWYGQQSVEEIHRKQQYLKTLINNRNISYHYHDGATGYMEAVFARGDRRLAKTLVEAWKLGCKFDGWTEFFSLDRWLEAFKNTGIDPDYYARRDRDFDEPLPWDHLDDTVTKKYLKMEWDRAVKAELTQDCRRLPCNGCNVCPALDTAIIDYKEGGRVEKNTFGFK
ncbi:TIGR03960 family B12-binding radical SAM protein [uncultured Veillonella sp.]|uniref:TIGR03960 family B12-binding radical SAM protein n=1 Tax=uncultured Veillonella sp. TaxID=159268 RepID=UPI0025D06B56|nr:TIGR03960 family B12-binding radical SAM protein [uncultured Veillonella sp.]MDY3974802.1 TIGR03960 family B12-binding radical SAM protein [Veillonella caviae]